VDFFNIRTVKDTTVKDSKTKKTDVKTASEREFSKKHISVIKNTVDIMLKNAKYGNHQGFLKNIRKIYDAASKLELQLED